MRRADVDDVAGELGGFGLGDGDATRGGVGGVDPVEGGAVEGVREVEDEAAGERGEAGVEVIEAGVDEVERGEGGVPGAGEVAMAVFAGARAVCGPDVAAGGIEEDVAFAFEGGLARSLPEQEAGVGHPAPEVVGFGLALGMGEVGDGGDAVLDDGGVSDEGHVG